MITRVWSQSKIHRFCRAGLHVFCNLILCIMLILFVPGTACTIGFDGSDRKNKNYQGIVMEYKDRLSDNIHLENVWKNEENGLSKCVLGYKQTVNKDAASNAICIANCCNDINEYLELLELPEYKSILINEFGEANCDFTPVDDQITTAKTDSQSVKYLSILHALYIIVAFFRFIHVQTSYCNM